MNWISEPGTRFAARVVALGLFAPLGWAASVGDIKRGEALYEVCGACHGAQGQGEKRMAVPAIAGQDGAYLLRQLRHFAQGTRGAPPDRAGGQMAAIMKFVAAEQDWVDILAYVDTLPALAAQTTVPSKGDRRHGAQLFVACSACHGERGTGNPAVEAPKLSGLQEWYIVSQLQNFRSGARGGAAADTAGAQMKAATAVLASAADVADVAAFIATLGADAASDQTSDAAVPVPAGQAAPAEKTLPLTEGRL